MILENKKNNATDQAWNQLHDRLMKDDLIPIKKEIARKPIIYSPAFKWAASAAVLFICILSVWFMKNTGTNELFTLYNEEEASTLVSTLEDGSTVYLSEQTSLQYPSRFKENKREVILQGEAFFEINKNPDRPFFINTESAIIEVLGTSFNVNSKNKSSFSLSVKNGEVKVTLKENNQSVNVKAGEAITLQTNRLHLTKVKSEQFENQSKKIHFKDERLINVIQIINTRENNIQLKIAPELENRLLTVSFSEENPQTIAKLICLALGLQQFQQDNTIFISQPKK